MASTRRSGFQTKVFSNAKNMHQPKCGRNSGFRPEETLGGNLLESQLRRLERRRGQTVPPNISSRTETEGSGTTIACRLIT